MLPNVGSSSDLFFYPALHYLPHTLEVGLHIESEAVWEDGWRYDVTTVIDLPKHHDSFHQYESVLRLTPKHFEIFASQIPAWIETCTAYRFQIYEGENFIMVRFSFEGEDVSS